MLTSNSGFIMHLANDKVLDTLYKLTPTPLLKILLNRLADETGLQKKNYKQNTSVITLF